MSKILWDSAGNRYECDKANWWNCRHHEGLSETPPSKNITKDQRDLLEAVIEAASDTFTDAAGFKVRTHHPSKCEGQSCSVHNPTEHVLSKGAQIWNDDDKMMERVCNHYMKHPDFDDVTYHRDVLGEKNYGKHNCDGCCGLEEKYVVHLTDGSHLSVPSEHLSEYLANSRRAGHGVVSTTKLLTVNELDELLAQSGQLGKKDVIPDGYQIWTCDCVNGDETWFYEGVCTTCGDQASEDFED